MLNLGQISVRQLCEVYSQAQAGLFLSEEETFGLAPLEMIAAGLPIVTTNVGVLKHEKAFVSLDIRMVNVGDIQGATEGLSEILMAKLEGPLPAVDFIRKNYSLSSITNQYLKMYQW
jgi:glycosyltransferase involved in cell wall biosynthesis